MIESSYNDTNEDKTITRTSCSPRPYHKSNLRGVLPCRPSQTNDIHCGARIRPMDCLPQYPAHTSMECREQGECQPNSALHAPCHASVAEPRATVGRLLATV